MNADDSARAVRIAVLGGSGASTPELFDALDAWPGGPERRPTLEIVLVGRSRDRLEPVRSACLARIDPAGRAVRVEATTDQRGALDGADIVLNQVRVGGLAARAFDESFPWAFDLPGEETMGPGGFASARRTVPVVLELLADVALIAPHALVVNLTNPAGIVTAAASRAFPTLRVVAVCDSPITLLDAVADRLGRSPGEVRRRYVGLNHLGWYVPESPAELDRIADLATGLEPGVVRLQQALPGPYVRYYVHPKRVLASQRGNPTRAEQLQQLEAEQRAAYARGQPDQAPRRGATWYGSAVVPVLDAWLHGSPVPLIVGLPNRGDVAGLPDGVVIERPVAAPGPGRLEPMADVPLPPLPAAMASSHAAYEMLAVEALVPGDRSSAGGGATAAATQRRASLLRALVANPMVSSYDQATGLLDAVLAADLA